jgi:hypothetical protein
MTGPPSGRTARDDEQGEAAGTHGAGTGEPTTGARNALLRRLVGGPLPWAIAGIAVVVALRSTQVGYRDIALFGLLQLVAYVLPGVLLWRGLRGRSSSWLHDVTFGTILAHAVTIPVYIAGQWVGAPLIVWAVPVVTVAAFSAIPSLRGYWRPAPGRREPAWLNWGMALCVVLLCAWYAGLSALNPINGPDVLWQSTDHTYLLALAGEVRNHIPPTTPYVVNEGLDYHWFTFADLAALNVQGGQELSLLLCRLGPLWFLVNGFVAFGLLGEQLAGRKTAGLLAIVLAVLVGSVSLLHGANIYVVDSTLLLVNWVGSPTQGFGQLLAMPVLLVAVGLLRGETTGLRPWILFAVLTVALMGAKATFIPVIGAGVALVVVIELVRHRRLPRAALTIGIILAAELAFAQLVLFGGAAQGLRLDPGGDIRRLGGSIGVPALTRTLPLASATIAIVFGWLAPLAGAGLLFLRPRPRSGRPGPADPATQLLVGMVVASIAVVLVFAQQGFSEYFFLRSGLPFAYLLVACGLVRIVEYVPLRTAIPRLAVAAAGGMAYALVSRQLSEPPVSAQAAAVRALALVVGACVVAGVAWGLGYAGADVPPPAAVHGPGRSARFALALACLSAATLGMGAARTVNLARSLPLQQPDTSALQAVDRPLPQGAFEAARYVRANSGPDDMFATNAHCLTPRKDRCDVRAFWMSAWTERRAVIEGWGYTATANDEAPTLAGSLTIPYWDQALLKLNDDVFMHPSPATLAALTDRYPVRWLIVDERFGADIPGLQALLPDHRTFGQATVFRVPGTPRD